MADLGSLFDQFAKAFKPDNNIVELEAIWMDRPVSIGTGEKKARLAPGMEIRVQEGFVADSGEPTHKIIGCLGTISSSELIFVLTDLKTNEPLNLRVK